jgi:uncharacterized protein (TIGR00159 family)
MPEGLLRLFAARPLTQIIRDLVDILVVAWVIYRALLVLRGTRAIQMAVGLGIALLVFLGARTFHFVTLQNLLSWLLSSIVLIVVVVFQNDIRRALIRMGGTAWFTGGREQQSRVIDEVVAAATELARHRMGALIAFEQDANVLEFVKSEGIQLDCVVTRELLVSLFVPESVNKLHDGAVLIRDLKIARAGVFFPMPDTKILDAQLGSRHRAALGITEETDAVVVVVSEERGTISFCFSGNIVSNLDGQSLRHALLGLFGRSAKKKRAGAKKTVAPPSVAPSRVPTSEPAPLTSKPASVAKLPPASSARPSLSSTPSPFGTPMKTPAPVVEPALPRPASAPMPAGKVTTSTPMRPSLPPPDPGRSGTDPGPTSMRASSFVPTTKQRDDDDGPVSRGGAAIRGVSATGSPLPEPRINEKALPASDPPPSGPREEKAAAPSEPPGPPSAPRNTPVLGGEPSVATRGLLPPGTSLVEAGLSPEPTGEPR